MEHAALTPALPYRSHSISVIYRDDLEFHILYRFPLTLRQMAWIVNPFKFFLLMKRPWEGQVRPPPAVQLPKQYVCSGSVGLTQYTSVSTMTWSLCALCGWATRSWQSKGMLMLVKNCSRDMLVSRDRSQMALDESVSTNTCKILIGILFRNK